MAGAAAVHWQRRRAVNWRIKMRGTSVCKDSKHLKESKGTPNREGGRDGGELGREIERGGGGSKLQFCWIAIGEGGGG